MPIRIRAEFWNAVTYFIRTNSDKPIIITGDLNTKSPEISENHASETHEYFSKFLEDSNLQILNDSTPTRGLNSLDVTIVNERFHMRTTNWEVINEFNSDHLPTITRTSFQATVRRKKGYESFYKYLDVPTTIKNLKYKVNNENINASDLSLSKFHGLILDSMQYKVSNKPGKAIWNNELTRLKRKRNKLRKRLNRGLYDDLNQIKSEIEQVNKEFRAAFYKAKLELRQEQAKSLASQRNIAHAWKLTNKFIPGTRKKSKKWNTHIESAISEANKIAEKFASISADDSIRLNSKEQAQADTALELLRL